MISSLYGMVTLMPWIGISRTHASRSLIVLACSARKTALTFSRRNAAFIMAGDNDCDTGSPATPYTLVAASTCSIRYTSRSVLAAICPGPVSSPTVAAANVNALPARSPSTRLITPCSPMHSPTIEWSWLARSRNFIMITLSCRLVAVVTSL